MMKNTVYLIDDDPGCLNLLYNVVEISGMEPRPMTYISLHPSPSLYR